MKIAGCLMLKNESKRISVTLNSLIGFVNGLIIFDTGSTDQTIPIIQEWCTTNSIPLHLKEGTFVDFSASRNELFDFADTIPDYDFLLLLDCNDELRGGEALRSFCEKELTAPTAKAYMVKQEWLTGTYINNYLNSRLVRKGHGWRFKKRVHEYLAPPPGEKSMDRPTVIGVVLYQNRNSDDDKTSKRFLRDAQLLEEDVAREGDPRDVFYLAQTYSCLNEMDKALKMYQRRGEEEKGFWEERFHSFLRMGEIYHRQGDFSNAIINFFKAAAIDCRAEPLVSLGKIYKDNDDHLTAYMFFRAAIDLDYPINNILFVSRQDYQYDRFQQHGISSYYIGRFTEGKQSIEVAKKFNPEINAQNEQFYAKAAAEGKKDVEFFSADDGEQLPEIVEMYKKCIDKAKKSLTSDDSVNVVVECLKAFQLIQKCEPLVILGEYCRLLRSFRLSYYITKMACEMADDGSHESKYLRWHLMGLVAHEAGKITDGKKACMKAIEQGTNIRGDRNNLKVYVAKEKALLMSSPAPSTVPSSTTSSTTPSVSVQATPPPSALTAPTAQVETQSQYVERRVQELKNQEPKWDDRRVKAKANLEWRLAQMKSAKK
jgi:tetratricopeptide (TPR) repeat protein